MHHTRLHFLVFTALLLMGNVSFSQTAAGTDTPSALVFFPSAHIYPRMYADGVAPGFGVSKDFRSAMIYGSLGGQIPLLEVNVLGTMFQAGAGAAVLTSIIKRPRLLQVVTIDFLVEFPVDVRLSERLTLRTGYGHFSAHFADDGIEILGRSSINYAKDYLMLFASSTLPALNGVVYAGGHWNFHSLPGEELHWIGQTGFEAGNLQLFAEGFLYAAMDIQCKSEVAWATTQSYQCGIRLFPRNERAVRITYTYRTGIDDRGQFYRERSTRHMVGVYLDF